MAEKLDPYDVGALEKSLNDSATRVSAIWVSFLIFAIYLLIIATTIEHRQLFLAEPVKLPVLNIDLPLWGFFFLAPILFVIFHAYVLLQVLLLGRTAAAYNEAVERAVKQAYLAPEKDAALRQRLANTLFAQIFSGSPREREGWLGRLLKSMAWITLALAPILIVVAFQFAFLPYHSHFVTWTHRLLILIELAVLFLIWPLVLDAQKDFDRARLRRWLTWPALLRRFRWTALKRQFGRIAGLSRKLFRPKEPKDERRRAWIALRHLAAVALSSLLFIIVSLSFATFPGEPHVNLFTGQSLSSVQCERWFSYMSRSFKEGRYWQNDRLNLPRVNIVDNEKLEKIAKATKDAGEQPHQGEPTRILRGRDFNCADISDFADLRRVDLTGAALRNASFRNTKLQGASLVGAQLQGASLDGTQLQGASLDRAQLKGASLAAELRGAFAILLLGESFATQLQGASLNGAQLQGASLDRARLQGASLRFAQLQGASLIGAQLQGASLYTAQLQGASLIGAQLQGASLDDALLQGASLQRAQLQGASFASTHLQGAELTGSLMTHARLTGNPVWLARNPSCHGSRVIGHNPKRIFAEFFGDETEATSDKIVEFIGRSIADIPEGQLKEQARERMRVGLDPTKNDNATIAAWEECKAKSVKSSEQAQQEFDLKFDQDHAEFLRQLVCEDTENGKAVAHGIIRNWISDADDRRPFSTQLARGLRGQDGRQCPGAKDLDQRDTERLRKFAPDSAAAQIHE